MTEEAPSWREELDRLILLRNQSLAYLSYLEESYEELQKRREKLTIVVEGGDQRPKLFGIKYGKDSLKKAFEELVVVRDEIEKVNHERTSMQETMRQLGYAIEHLRDKLDMNKEGVL